MFSSWVNKLTSGHAERPSLSLSTLSPKAWLANQIVATLDDFFVLDKDGGSTMESNLLRDTKISLKQAQVRPRLLDTAGTIWLYGSVDEMEFSWKWGSAKAIKGEGSSFVKDTRLSIKGASFRIVITTCSKEEGVEKPGGVGLNRESSTSTVTTAASSTISSIRSTQSTNNSSNSSGFIQQQIQQIVDHLTLDIADITVNVVKEDSARPQNQYGINLRARGLQLVSFGRLQQEAERDSGTDGAPPLSQRISLQSISLSLEPSLQTSPLKMPSLPLLDPIGYAASVTRVSGRRFMDGWMTGLEVVGEVCASTADNSGFVIHAGTKQVQTLSRILNQVLSSQLSEPPIEAVAQGNDDVYFDSLDYIPPPKHESSALPTTLSLPLPSITVVLPQGSKVTMPQAQFDYHVDGSVSELYGNKGIWMNLPINDSVQPLLDFAHGGGAWKLDFVSQKVTLGRSGNHQGEPDKNASVAQITWDDKIVRHLVQETMQLSLAVPQTVAEQVQTALKDYAKEVVAKIENNSDSLWSFQVDGTISMRVLSTFASNEDSWAEAILQSPSLVASPSQRKLISFQIGGAKIGPTSFGETKSSMIQIPAVVLDKEDDGLQTLVFQGDVDATLESMAAAYKLQDFGTKLVDFSPEASTTEKNDTTTSSKPLPSSSSDSKMTPFPTVKIPGIKMRLEKESLGAILGAISLSMDVQGDASVTVGTVVGLTLKERGPVEIISAQGLCAKTSTQNNHRFLNLEIQQIDKINWKGYVDSLEIPIQHLSVAYNQTKPAVQANFASPLHLAVSPALLDPTKDSQASKATASDAASMSLAFPIEVCLSEMRFSMASTKAAITVQPLQVSLSSVGKEDNAGIMAQLMSKKTSARLEVVDPLQGTRWLQASIIGSLNARVSGAGQIEHISCDPLQFDTNAGDMSIHMPASTFREKSAEDGLCEFNLNGLLHIDAGSLDVAKDLLGLVYQAMGISYKDNNKGPVAAPSQKTTKLSLLQETAVSVEQARITLNKSIRFEGEAKAIYIHSNEVRADTLTCVSDMDISPHGPLSASVSGVRASMSPDYQHFAVVMDNASVSAKNGLDVCMAHVDVNWKAPLPSYFRVGRVDTLLVPEMFELLEPTCNASLSYTDGELNMKLENAICGVCPLMDTRSKTASATTFGETVASVQKPMLPFPVHVELSQQLLLMASNESKAVLCVSSINCQLVPGKADLTLITNSETKMCVRDDILQQQWLQTTIGPLSATVTSYREPKEASCSHVSVGPCSFGQASLKIPDLVLNNEVLACGDVTGIFESTAVADSILSLCKECFPSDKGKSFTMPASLQIPQVVVTVSELKNTKAIFQNVWIAKTMDRLSCGRFGFQDGTGKAVAFSGLRAKQTLAEVKAEIAAIDALYLPGSCTLENPSKQTIRVAFQGDACRIDIPAIEMIILETSPQKQDKGNLTNEAPTRTALGFDVPFPILFNVQHVKLKSFTRDGEVTKLSQLTAHVKPQERDPFALEGIPQAVTFQVVLGSAENKLLKLDKTSTWGVFYTSDINTIHRFKLATEHAELTAGFSSMDWSSVFANRGATKEESEAMAMPNCTVDEFTIHLQYRGKVVGMRRTAVSIPAFQGGQNTTSKDLIYHLKKATLDRLPAMITNAQVLGESVTEMSAKMAGQGLLAANSVALPGVGAVVGLVAQDSIRGSIAKGKASRGAQGGEAYKFGDFTRGVIRSAKQSINKGAEIRTGSADSSYQFGDFTVGAASGIANYAGREKARLGSAGVVGAAAAVGMVAAGPLGLVAGSIIGSKLGHEVFEDDKPKSSLAPSTQAPHPRARPSDDGDLLQLSSNNNDDLVHTQITPAAAPLQQFSKLPTQQQSIARERLAAPSKASNAPSPYPRKVHESYTSQPHSRARDTASTGSQTHRIDLDNLYTRIQRQKVSTCQTGPITNQTGQLQQQQYPNHNSQQGSLQQHNQQHSRQRHNQQGQQYQQQQQNLEPIRPPQRPQQPKQEQGYKFGDLTRSVIAKGKAKDGRSSNDSYKFGDFTRGLFK
jgi:hypothetical protein